MYLCRISGDSPEALTDFGPDLDRFRKGIGRNFPYLFDEMGRLEDHPLPFNAPGEREHLPDHSRAPKRAGLKRIENRLALTVGKPPLQYFKSHRDRGEHIVEVVGDPAGQGPYAFHPLAAQE